MTEYDSDSNFSGTVVEFYTDTSPGLVDCFVYRAEDENNMHMILLDLFGVREPRKIYKLEDIEPKKVQKALAECYKEGKTRPIVSYFSGLPSVKFDDETIRKIRGLDFESLGDVYRTVHLNQEDVKITQEALKNLQS